MHSTLLLPHPYSTLPHPTPTITPTLVCPSHTPPLLLPYSIPTLLYLCPYLHTRKHPINPLVEPRRLHLFVSVVLRVSGPAVQGHLGVDGWMDGWMGLGGGWIGGGGDEVMRLGY